MANVRAEENELQISLDDLQLDIDMIVSKIGKISQLANSSETYKRMANVQSCVQTAYGRIDLAKHYLKG